MGRPQTMRNLRLRIILSIAAFVGCLVVWCWIVHSRTAHPLERGTAIIDIVVLCIVSGVLIAWGRDVLTLGLDYFTSRLVSRNVERARLPYRFEMQLGEIRDTDSWIFICFQNISPDAVHGRIAVKDVSSDDVLAQLQLVEPEPLLGGVWGREQGWWSRGTASVRSPIRIHLPKKVPQMRALRLECELDWNFIGTRMEHKIPKDRTLHVEVVLRANRTGSG